MKRKIRYCLLLAIIGAILLFVLTIKFTALPLLDALPILFAYFGFTSIISISVLGIIIDRKSKEHLFSLLTGVDGLVLMVNLMIGFVGKIDESMRNIVTIIIQITFMLFVILCGCWSKFEKNK